MFKSVFILALMILPFKAIANDLHENAYIAGAYCVDEDLNIQEINTGEAFYLWITVGTKIA